ncbi:hypothetical protein [Chromobacterium alticapitis]|uniref:Uncharacterized protein n=1 Tax=Chromobacterium alticapitis TaxID=2073169 RepID=A0A2S5DL16_9NEIS|nr:hypothetical protein [Chromobacterium alticapitis]POZ63775.1 hypothetical protein C2I19_01605 [Chromobacterium alticapitis]
MEMKYAIALSLCLASLGASAATPCAASAACPAASEPARAALHFRREPPPSGAGLLGPYEMLGGLALLGAAGCWWRLRKPRSGLAEDGPSVVGKCRLSAKSSVYVLRHRDREIMLAESEHGITVIRDEART